MAILAEIRKRPVLLMGIIALALLAFLVNPDSIDKVFGKNPDILGKVNGEKITREEFNDELFILQQQAQQQGRPTTGLEEQAWQMLVQSKLIKQQFDKMGMELTEDMFWNQLQFDPLFANNPANFDEKGNFKVNDIKKQIEDLKNSGNAELYSNWLKMRKSIEYRMMARQLFANVSNGITTSKKEAEAMMKFRDQLANIEYVKVDYNTFLLKNPIKVTTQDLADYIKEHQVQFKTQPTRNLGVVYFPANPSAADDAKTKAEIEKLLNIGSETSEVGENFRNTTNDSMYVSLNSDTPFNPGYFSVNQLPLGIRTQVASASVGQVFGPYKEQNLYVVSKLVDKKPSDSTLSRHILISYKGAQNSSATRTKEQAKKLADSVLAVVKADPSKFDQELKLSDEPNAVERGGSVGWATPSSQFAEGYLNFLSNNSKGSTGLAETQFGYHIINIQDKKSGSMGYKVANLVKTVKPSEATLALVDKNSRRFIQQVQGKTLNEFSQIAKKNKYQYSNPTSVQRFAGNIQGLGTEEDEDILAWAFDKKRKVGETEMFTDDATGGKIVVYLNGIYDEDLADPESVRLQIEPIVKNKLAAKKIIEKINAAKVSNLNQAAKLFATAKQNAQANMLNPLIGGAMEPKVAGAAFGVAKGKLSQPVEGQTGVYLVVKTSETINKQPGDAKQVAASITQQNSQMFGQMLLKSLQDNADIEDYRIEVWNKVKNQQQ